ncbi:MAG: hypothetical protein VX113_04055, partial [Pseudomonadota bacterium]|nr:hypothetical protein [Pseudomonadota bacterium]
MLNNDGKPPVKRGGIFGRLRSWFFTGLLVTAPVLLTVYITWAAIKLIDFGYAGHCTPTQPLRGLCGTPDYAAPEILTWYQVDKAVKPQGTPYAQVVDMWSLGVVLYILLCGFPPFYGDDDEQMF